MLARLLPLGALLSASVVVSMSACSGSDTNEPGATAGHAGKPSAGSPSQGGSHADAGSSATGGSAGVTTNGGAAEGGGEPQGVAGEAMGGGGGAPSGGESNLGSGGAGACHVEVAAQALAAGNHVTACTPVTYATNPPSSGEHYPVWADYGVYDFPLPRGFWVHNLEHGSVVVTYNCAGGCADEVAAATTWLNELTVDAQCTGGTPRVLLLPDPLLDVRWAASSWGYTLRADCFDADAFSAFYTAHAGMPPAPEAAACSTGLDYRDPNAETCGANPQ